MSKKFDTIYPHIYNLDHKLQSIIINMIGSDRPVSSAYLAEKVGRSSSWIFKTALPKIKEALEGVAVIDSSRKGLSIRLLESDSNVASEGSADEKISDNSQLPIIFDKVGINSGNLYSALSELHDGGHLNDALLTGGEEEVLSSLLSLLSKGLNVKVDMARRIKNPHWFILPWGGCVDLHNIVGVQAEHGKVVLQLLKGGFLRGPIRNDAEKIAKEIVETLIKLPSVNVTFCDVKD